MGLAVYMTETMTNRTKLRSIAPRAVLLGAALLALGACQMIGGGAGVTTTAEQPGEMDAGQRTFLAAGQDAEDARKYDVAANAYGRLYERRPQDVEVLVAFVRNMRYSGRSVEIISYLDQKIPHMLAHDSVQFEYAKALLAAGRKAQALAALQESVTKRPAQWDVHSALGIAFDGLGRFVEAIAAYQHALSLSPDNVVVMNNMAMSQAMAGQLQNAIATLERAANINRANPHVRQNLALLYGVNGDVDKARALAAMDLDSSDVETNLSFYRRFSGAGK